MYVTSHVWMWELGHKEGWASKNWCFWCVVLEKILESPLDWKDIQPVHTKGNQFWIFFGRTDAEAEAPILWPPDAKNRLWKRLWCWERLKAGREGDDRGWDGWMASLTWLTGVWVGSRNWWWTGKPGVLQSMGFQRVGHNLETELTDYDIWNNDCSLILFLLYSTQLCTLLCCMNILWCRNNVPKTQMFA